MTAEHPDVDFPFALTSGRVEHPWHTLTKTGKVASLNKLNPGAFLEIHPADAAQLGVHQGPLVKVAVKVAWRRGFSVYPTAVTTCVRPGECFAQIHWNDLFGENPAVNAATSEAVDEISLQPEFKYFTVALSKVVAGVQENVPFTPAQREFIGRLLAEQEK